MVLAMCEDLDPFIGIPINKKDFGTIIILIDSLVIASLLIFTWALDIGQQNYVKMYLDHTIDMSDFTIRISNLPDEKHCCPGDK